MLAVLLCLLPARAFGDDARRPDLALEALARHEPSASEQHRELAARLVAAWRADHAALAPIPRPGLRVTAPPPLVR